MHAATVPLHCRLLPHFLSFRQILQLKVLVCCPGLVVWSCLSLEWLLRCWLLHIVTEARLEAATHHGDDRRLIFFELSLLLTGRPRSRFPPLLDSFILKKETCAAVPIEHTQFKLVLKYHSISNTSPGFQRL